MISTLYLIQFVAFYFWQSTSKVHKSSDGRKSWFRLAGIVLLVLSVAGFIWQWGLLSGCCGSVFGLMGVGCLSVVLAPFKYIRVPGLITLYICFVVLEIFI